MCGSLFLNKRFERAVQSLVGENQYAKLRNTPDYSSALHTFDREIKTTYEGGQDEEYRVEFLRSNLRNDVRRNLISGTWTMTGFVYTPASIWFRNTDEK
jgi:hypothetical protein